MNATNKIGEIRNEVLRALDRDIEAADSEIRDRLDWVASHLASAQRDFEAGNRPSNGFLLRASSTHELDLATARSAALKAARREIAAIIDSIDRRED